MTAVATGRAQIDAIDRRIVALLAERRRAVDGLARDKAALGLPAVDAGREAELREAWSRAASEEGLPPEVSLAVLDAVLGVSRERVRAIFRGDDPAEER